jgi:hypothetical protein
MLFIAAKILGAAAIFFFALAFLNFVLKYSYRTLPGYFKKHPKYAKIHLAMMKFFVKIQIGNNHSDFRCWSTIGD